MQIFQPVILGNQRAIPKTSTLSFLRINVSFQKTIVPITLVLTWISQTRAVHRG